MRKIIVAAFFLIANFSTGAALAQFAQPYPQQPAIDKAPGEAVPRAPGEGKKDDGDETDAQTPAHANLEACCQTLTDADSICSLDPSGADCSSAVSIAEKTCQTSPETSAFEIRDLKCQLKDLRAELETIDTSDTSAITIILHQIHEIRDQLALLTQ